jgi:A/G-specific adenine glycosylase
MQAMRGEKAMKAFRAAVWRHYRAAGRHDLAWRKTKHPYKILVSEVMLQQTQVPRVIEKYKEFLKAFPTVRALAQAPLADVLRVWSGMGYNRRAKYLREGARVIVEEYGGRVPKDAATLRQIPGIGPYTASAVLIFAYNVPDTMIETNIRAAYIHHFFPNHKKAVNDRDLLPFISKAAEGQDPREWHWALMDYGSHLKKLHGNPARKSAHYAKQSKFDGSIRQVRGAILHELHKGPSSLNKLPFEKDRIESALAGLARDGLIIKQRGKWQIS